MGYGLRAAALPRRAARWRPPRWTSRLCQGADLGGMGEMGAYQNRVTPRKTLVEEGTCTKKNIGWRVPPIQRHTRI